MKDKDNDAIEDLVGAAVDMAASVVGGAVLGPPGVALGLATKAIRAGIRRVATDRAASRAEAFEDELAARFMAAPAVDEAELLTALESEPFREVIFQSYRRAMDAIDPAAVPVLARLASLYVDRPLDPFFRGAGRVLQDLDASELARLRQEMRAVCAFFARAEGPDPVSWTFQGPDASHLVHVLQANALVTGVTRVARPDGGVADHVIAFVSHDVAERFAIILGGE